MSGPFDFATPTALQFFANLVADDESLALLEAAASLTHDVSAAADTQATLGEIDSLAATLKRRIPSDAAALQRLRLLNHYFFKELGFAGNVNDFYDPRNSYLCEVLRRRRGIPITLALIYIEIATQIGLEAAGVAFPGHFLVKLHMAQGEVIIDPFSGESLSRSALDERLMPYRAAQGLTDEEAIPLSLFLQTASARDTMARLLRNLKQVHQDAGDWMRLCATLDRLVILLPEDWRERRDRGWVHARLGQLDLALQDITAYLAHCPEAQDAAALEQQVLKWRSDGAEGLH